jgi:hypothetical protein
VGAGDGDVDLAGMRVTELVELEGARVGYHSLVQKRKRTVCSHSSRFRPSQNLYTAASVLHAALTGAGA